MPDSTRLLHKLRDSLQCIRANQFIERLEIRKNENQAVERT